MERRELQEFCAQKNILLDNSLIHEFCLIEEDNFLKIFLEKIKSKFNRSFFNKKFIEENRETIFKILKEISVLKGLDFSKVNFFNFETKPEIKKEEIKLEGGNVKVNSSLTVPGKTFEVKDFLIHFRNRYDYLKDVLSNNGELDNLNSIGKIPFEKQKLSVIGMVLSKKETKNKNLILEIEDLTGKIKDLISSDKKELIEKAEDINLDSVIGFSGFGNKDILFVNNFVFPEAVIPKRKKSEQEEYALFIGDVHFGSKNFLEKDFFKFIDYINGNSPTEEVKKIKYLFIVGDLITGIGNYPNQEGDLKLKDLESQFLEVSKILSKIRKDIKIIISPGNHDCVRLMEPQPMLDEKYAWPLYDLENVIITENPCSVNIGKTEKFEGFDILTYHGFSFPYFANTVPNLLSIKAMNQPEKIMKHLLLNRHLAPTHSSTQYFPLEQDGLLIRDAPDIFVSGHTHKSGVTYFNNILTISVSSWESKTAYQEKFGNEPDHCKVPMFNLKTREVKILDFESKEENK